MSGFFVADHLQTTGILVAINQFCLIDFNMMLK